MDILSELKNITDEKNILINEPLKNHTTFKIGGNADFIVMPQNKSEAVELMRFVIKKSVPYFILGNGSNLLVSDNGFRGVVVKTFGCLNKITTDGNTVVVEAGVLLSGLSSVLTEKSLSGFEEMSGIPGTFGGAVYMNAGAYGREIKDVLYDVTFIDGNGNLKTLKTEELNLGYRKSIFSENGGFVLEGTLKLQHGNKEQIKAKVKEITKLRTEKQPLNYPSAGSTFKRPEGHFAGKLIEDCGLKGYSVGGAKISEKHAGFVINYDNATYEDVINLIDDVKRTVKDRFGVNLESEVKIL